MRHKLTLRAMVDRYWELVEICLIDAFAVDHERARKTCESWRVETNGGWYVSRWSRLSILYHEEPLYLAHSIAVLLGAIEPDADPEACLAARGLNYDRLAAEVFAGRVRSAAIHEASLA